MSSTSSTGLANIGFCIIPPPVMVDDSLTSTQKLVLGRIIGLSNSEGHCWAKNETLAPMLGMSERNVSRHVSNLVNKGYLKRTQIKDETGRTKERHLKPQIGLDWGEGDGIDTLPRQNRRLGGGQKCPPDYRRGTESVDTPVRARAREGEETEGETEGYSGGGGGTDDTAKLLTSDQREEASDALEVAWCGADRGYKGATTDKALAQWAGLLNSGYSHEKVLTAMLGLAKMREDRAERVRGWINPGDPFNPAVLPTDVKGERLIETAASYYHKHGPPQGDTEGGKRRTPPDKYRCRNCGGETIYPEGGCGVCGDGTLERVS